MNVSIIGTGRMAHGIATRALAGGHTVSFVGHTPDKAQEAAAELGDGASAAQSPDGDVVVLAVYYGAHGDVLATHGDALDGKVVVDISNPLDFETFSPLQIDAGSATAELAAKLPGAKLVKAFNTTFAGTLVAGAVDGQPLDVLIAGDDDGAKAAVKQLAEDGGLRGVDVGSLDRAHELEALGFLHISLQDRLGTGFGSAIKFLG